MNAQRVLLASQSQGLPNPSQPAPQFFMEKNPTIVNFPVKNLELAACVPVPQGAPQPQTMRSSNHAPMG